MISNLKAKKIILFFLSLSCFFLTYTVGFAKPVTVDTAMQVAANWMLQQTGIGHQALEDSIILFEDGAQDRITPYYIFNMYPGGWVIVSGDDIAYPIIGYAVQGAVDAEDVPPAFSEWMAQIEEQITEVVKNDLEPLAETETAWESLIYADYELDEASYGAVSPLVQTTWSQGKYYNASCPADSNGPDDHAYVGCVATAAGQIMKYHNWPVTGTGSHSYYHSTYGTLSANFGATTYNWSSMPASGQVTSYNTAVATLLYHVGVSVNMNYGPSGSGANSASVPAALRTYFKYNADDLVHRSSYSTSVWLSKIKTDHNAGRPVYYRSPGHAFVCDGYTGTNYFHFNWGWNGSYDGYFYLNDLTPGSRNYNSNQGAIFGIEPEGVTPSAQVTSLWSVPDTSPGDTAVLWAQVKNIGTSSFPSNIKVWFWVTGPGWSGSHWVGSADVSELVPGSGQWRSYHWSVPSGANPGTYTYWARVYIGSTTPISDWSTSQKFSIIGPPPAATLISPSGTICDTTPTYTWNAVSSATWYYLWVNGPSGKVFGKWYKAAEVTSGLTCSVTPSKTLAEGAHTWWIRTWNPYGYGPWSYWKKFTVDIGPPPAATLVSPSGTTSDTTPTFTWNAVSNATWYYLWVNDSSGKIFGKWYTSAAVTSGSTCSVTPSKTLADGAHIWWIRTYNPYGYGPWSHWKRFTVTSGGFNSQFNGDATGWGVHSGTWWIASNAFYTTQGLAGTCSSVSYADTFSDFDYRVKLWRNGSNSNASRIRIRGTPYPLGYTNWWNSSYWFQYTRNGLYSVYKTVSATTTCLQSWASTSAINQGSAWNTLRVVANGTNLYFYINGTLVWSGSDSSLTSGKVGFGMYRDASSSGNQLWADWATLTEGSTAITDTVSDEQQALNEEANEHRVGNENVSK